MNEAVALVAQAVATSSASGLCRISAIRLRGGGRPRCGRNGSGSVSMPASRASITATSAATAAKESWKLTPRIASGSSDDHREDGEGEVAHGQRPPVHDHRAEHDQRHHQRPLGADARAGGDVVEERARHGDGGRPFLDRVGQRERRRQRQQPARHDEENPRDQRHLHAGDGDDVEDAGLANEVLGVVGEEVALARHHGGGDRALVAADDPADPQARGRCGRGRSAAEKRWLRLASAGGGSTCTCPSVEPTAPTPAKNASRAKS